MSRRENFIQEALPGISAQSVTLGNLDIPPVQLPKTPNRVEQLVMYKTPTEIMKEYIPLRGDMHAGETPDDTWRRKAEESRTGLSGNSRVNSFYGIKEDDPDTLENSIKREGVQNPVTLQTKELSAFSSLRKPSVFGGHHRIATAAKINPDMLVPVEYADTFYDSSTNKRRQGEDPGSPDKPRFPVAKEPTSSSSRKSSSSKKSSSSNKS
jgi:hypothetical protein